MESLTGTQHRASEEKEEEYANAMQLATSVVLPMTLRGAIELGIFEIMAQAGDGAELSASDIAARVQSQNNKAPVMFDRILRLLATHSVLHCSVLSGERVYSLAPVCKYFVRNEDGVAILDAMLALVTDKVFMDPWYQLKEAVVEGGVPFERVHRMNAYEYPRLDERFNKIFNTAMHNNTSFVSRTIAETYKGFEDIKQLVDVGGGLGLTLKSITSKHPHIKGINFDLPHVIQHAEPYPDVEHRAGDMFQSVPKGDAIFLKWVLHDWSDELCSKLLKNCYESLPANGKVIVVERVLPQIPGTSAASKGNSQIDMILLTQYSGGKGRTHHEFLNLAIGAGFSGITLESPVCNFWVMEFYK